MIPVQCTPLPPLTDHLIMNVTAVTLNSILTFSCMGGYELVGDATMVCDGDGKWNVNQPKCQSKYCKLH